MSSSLIIPVYLNQRIVFDLLAMREGGLAQVTRVASSEQSGTSDQRRYGAEFGLSKAFSSLLSISVKGDRTKIGAETSTSSVNEERVHTPASLFFRLREQLMSDGELIRIEDGSHVEHHHLVEFDAELTRNPLLETMDSMASLMEMATMFDDEATQHRGHSKPKPKNKSEHIVDQIKSFGEKLRAGDSVDVVADSVGGTYRALITLEKEYLNDPTMADLVDGKFKVVGKVIRIVGTGGRISLLRKSALSLMPQSVLDGMIGALASLSLTQGFKFPALKQEIEGPALQVLPLAIFA